MMETAKLPLSRASAITDLRWHLDQTGNVPGRPALRARWGWTDHAVRMLLLDEAAWLVDENRQRVASRSPAGRQPVASDRMGKRRLSSRNRQRVASASPARRQPVATRALIQTSDSDDRLQTEDNVVPQAHPPAAPPALGPADPDTEPDWDALFEAVPLTYDEETTDEAAEDEGPVGTPAGAIAPASAVTSEESATQPPPVTRRRKAPRPAPVGDVETLWEAWRVHGTVRGEPNPRRKRLLQSAIEAHGLSAMVDLLDAAHTGDDRYWRFLQGATPESDAVYLSPETLLNGRLVERVERAAGWVEGGRRRHEVTETRAEARAEAVARPALERARAAWPYAVKLIGAPPDALGKLVEGWPETNARALRDGLAACGGLMALGRADEYKRHELRRKFLAGVVAALGGTVTDAELREVG